jgi:hypothetical protein
LATGSISGTVRQSDTAAPVQGATLALVGAVPPVATTTAADGAYTLANVPTGAQTVRMTAPGYQTLSASVTVTETVTRDFTPAAVMDYVSGDGGDTCSVEYAWVDATGGTPYNLSDDGAALVTLPWDFTFYGNTYTSVYVNANGFASFGASYALWHGIVPFEGRPNNQIIGLGGDLNPASGSQGVVYTQELPDGRFVIEYDRVQHFPSGNPETFEIILHPDGTIVLQYQAVSLPDGANAGIENTGGSRGILYSYANTPPLYAGLAVKFAPFSGQAPTCTAAAAPALAAAADGTTAVLSWPHQPPNTSYQVWRDTAPYFTPVGDPVATLTATGDALTYEDPDRIGDPDVNYFWVVRGVVAGGASGSSNQVGEFDFRLALGD